MSDWLEVEFQGRRWLWLRNEGGGGALTTKARYENFVDSYAHVYAHGPVMRQQKTIGTIDDVRVIRELRDDEEPKPPEDWPTRGVFPQGEGDWTDE